MIKWLAILFVAGIIYMVSTGNMGGAKKATQNYADTLMSKTTK